MVHLASISTDSPVGLPNLRHDQQAGLKKTKVGTVIPNSDQNLPNGRYSKK